jgi:hypothetical protein
MNDLETLAREKVVESGADRSKWNWCKKEKEANQINPDSFRSSDI